MATSYKLLRRALVTLTSDRTSYFAHIPLDITNVVITYIVYVVGYVISPLISDNQLANHAGGYTRIIATPKNHLCIYDKFLSRNFTMDGYTFNASASKMIGMTSTFRLVRCDADTLIIEPKHNMHRQFIQLSTTPTDGWVDRYDHILLWNADVIMQYDSNFNLVKTVYLSEPIIFATTTRSGDIIMARQHTVITNAQLIYWDATADIKTIKLDARDNLFITTSNAIIRLDKHYNFIQKYDKSSLLDICIAPSYRDNLSRLYALTTHSIDIIYQSSHSASNSAASSGN